jgi:DNA invertase Pin-like site-specific DNA recombinase
MSLLVTRSATFSDHRTPPFTAESHNIRKSPSYRWSELVFEMKVSQNRGRRIFDVSGNVIGYARVSTRGQSLDSQVDALVAAGAVRVFQEYASGATQARTRWKECLDYLQPGNVLTVADLTRLGRSTADLADIVTVLGRRGIGFRSLAEPWLDTTSAHGKLIFDMFASLAEYERSRLSERTKAGLTAAKARGRPRTMTPAKTEAARQLRSQGKTLKETAQILSVSVSECQPCGSCCAHDRTAAALPARLGTHGASRCPQQR